MKKVLLLPIVTFIGVFFFLLSTTKAHADIINPEFREAHCAAGEEMITCPIPGFAPGASPIDGCIYFKNNPNYYFLASEGHSYGGTAKYCKKVIAPRDIVKKFDWKFWAIGLAITIILELLFLTLVGFRTKKTILAIVFANIISFTAFQLIFALTNLAGIPAILIAEIAIVFFEFIFIYLYTKTEMTIRGLFAVLGANILSATLGTYLISLLFK